MHTYWVWGRYYWFYEAMSFDLALVENN